MIPQNKYESIRQTSPLEACSDILGGKYKCYILWNLLQNGSLRYGQLRRLVPCATARVLTKQLKELENDGLLARTVVSEKPLHVTYALTAEGKKFEPLLLIMRELGVTLLRRQRDKISLPSTKF